jgi:hypothetical protein
VVVAWSEIRAVRRVVKQQNLCQFLFANYTKINFHPNAFERVSYYFCTMKINVLIIVIVTAVKLALHLQIMHNTESFF